MKIYTQVRDVIVDPDTNQNIPMDTNNKDYRRVLKEIDDGDSQIMQAP